METEQARKSQQELERELREAEISFGPDHLNTARALENLARFLSAQHLDRPQHPDVVPLCRRAVEIIRKHHGEESIQYSEATFIYAQMLVHAGGIVEAIPILFESWQLSKKFLGSDHARTDIKRFMFIEYIEEVEKSGVPCSFDFNRKPAKKHEGNK